MCMHMCILYTEFVDTQPICTPVTLHHTKLVELLFSSRCSAADVPLLSAHDLVEAV